MIQVTSGFLIIDKPAGPTSFQVVARVRRWSGVRRVGHAGTLDPMAQGVLPLGLGQATRVIQFLAQASKEYRAVVELGLATDTYDATGRAIQRADPSTITRGQVEAALSAFRGAIRQYPPPYSALKYGGRPLYAWARSGVVVEAPPREVEVLRLELTGWRPPLLELEVECSKGTYIRSLAHDLGQALGCGAHLRALVRSRCGPFRLEEAIPLPQAELAFREGRWPALLHPLERALTSLEALVVDQEGEALLGQGRPLLAPPPGPGGEWRQAHSQDGRLLALLRYRPDRALWHPEKVFIQAKQPRSSSQGPDCPARGLDI